MTARRTIAVNDVYELEELPQHTVFNFTVSLSNASSTEVTVDYASPTARPHLSLTMNRAARRTHLRAGANTKSVMSPFSETISLNRMRPSLLA